jgi:glycosyltransferase involved in cell wall biosynthesis
VTAQEPAERAALRVLVVTHYYAEHRGGVEAVAAQLVQRLARRGLEVRWAASDEEGATGDFGAGEGEGATGPQPSAPSWRRVPMGTWNVTERRLGFPYPLWGPRSLWRLRREVRDADIVHLHDSLYFGSCAAFLFARRARRPVVVTQHIGLVPYSNPLLRWLHGLANRVLGRLVLRGAARWVYISPKVRDYFLPLLTPLVGAPPLYIANGVETAIFHPLAAEERRERRAALGWPPGRPVLLFVGRYVEKKGLGILRQLAQRLPEPLWVFIGWGPDDPAAWGLPQVRVLPPMAHPALAAAFQAADLLVLPSVGEGFPLVVQEAMACGTPAMITPDTAAGCPEVVPVTWIAEPTADDFAALLRSVLAAPAAIAERRKGVAEIAHRLWSWEAAADSYAALFRELADAARSRPPATPRETLRA